MYQRLDPIALKQNKWKRSLPVFGKFLEWLVFSTALFLLVMIASPYLPTKKYFTSFIVTSGSMEPAIAAGSIAIVMPIDASLIAANDVIAFASPQDPSKTILHRVKKVLGNQKDRVYVTKGDNNRQADQAQVRGKAIKGLMFLTVPYIGLFASFIRTKLGFAILIGIPAALLLYLNLRQIMAGFDEEVRKRAYNFSLWFGLFLLAGVSISPVLIRTIVAVFNSSSALSGLSLSTKDYAAPPSPTLVAPPDNIVRETEGLVMDWSDVADFLGMNNPVYYIYQSARNSGFSPLAYQSGKLSASQIPAPGTPDGIYWWRVKACDQLDNCSPWSAVWKAVIDSRPPVLNASLADDGLNVSSTLSQLSRFVSYIYSLTYDTDSEPEGYNGSVTLTGQNDYSKGFYLGTCSEVCTPHTGIHNLKLTIDMASVTGKIYHLESSF